MNLNYSYASPSLAGVLSHESLSYEGVRRSAEVMKILDGPSAAERRSRRSHEGKMLEQYFYDLYGVFMKKLSGFVLEPKPGAAEELKLQALLQEMIRVKHALAA